MEPAPAAISGSTRSRGVKRHTVDAEDREFVSQLRALDVTDGDDSGLDGADEDLEDDESDVEDESDADDDSNVADGSPARSYGPSTCGLSSVPTRAGRTMWRKATSGYASGFARS